MTPGVSTAKLIGAGVGLLAVIAFVLMAFHWKGQAADRKEKLETICATTRLASNQPKLNCGAVPQQITEMGKSIGTLKAAIASQNAKVAALGTETARQQQLAAQASREAAQRAKRASDRSSDLQASSRAPERLKQPCEPSKALQEAWR